MELLLIFVSTVLVENFVLTKFLGVCPFLGVSNKLDSALSMGAAVTFVLVLTAGVTWVIQNTILAPFGIDYLQPVLFIIVIADLVQFVEMVIRKTSDALYSGLGIYLPLITTNCCVMGLALFGVLREYSFIQNIVFGIGAGVGFTLALVIMAGIREKIEYNDISPSWKGTPIVLITSGLMAMAFFGFSGLI